MDKLIEEGYPGKKSNDAGDQGQTKKRCNSSLKPRLNRLQS